MTVDITPWAIDGNTHSASDARALLCAQLGGAPGAFVTSTTATDDAHGVATVADLAVAQNGTPNMSVNVTAGNAFVRCGEADSQAYHVRSTAVVNLSIAAADAVNARKDLVLLQVRDAQFSGALRDARLVVVTGTPAASPADPSLASFPSALVLARVDVPALDTAITDSQITTLRRVARASSGIVKVTSSTRPIGAAGMRIFETDTLRELRHDGTGWIIMAEPVQTGFTPVWSNVTLGSGVSNLCWYQRSNGRIDITWRLILGTGGGPTGVVAVSTPMALGAPLTRGHFRCSYHNIGVGTFEGGSNEVATGATSLTPFVGTTSATYLASDTITATIPFTWGNGDMFMVSGWAFMQTLYL